MKHYTRPNNHRVLGQTVEVISPRGLVVSIYTGAYATERAEQRARELDAAAEDSTEKAD